jgi:hypothetical protein
MKGVVRQLTLLQPQYAEILECLKMAQTVSKRGIWYNNHQYIDDASG